MNENKIIETLKYISQFVENRHDEGLGDYLHIVIGRADINVIDETIHLLERKQKEIEELKENELLEITENFISKDKIRELKEKVEKEMISNPYDFSYMINELLEENDG